jgi:molybdenum cofactor cytidylyltransferase
MKIEIIYLAAGNSRRFGSNKLCYELNNRPMYQYGLETLENVLEKVEETSLTVVTEFPEIREYVMQMKKHWKDRVRMVGSPNRKMGISYSIQAGLETCRADYYLFCVADQPWILADTIVELITKTLEGNYIGGYVEWNGISGNPVIFSNELREELLALQGDTGGKKILKCRENVCTVQAKGQREVKDIDTKVEIE